MDGRPNVDYVVGFLFRRQGRFVALIQKTRPSWQIGKFNGIGGGIENFESPKEAMIREFKEESGASITDWKQFAVLTLEDKCKVYCFSSFQWPHQNLKSLTDEKISWIPVLNLQDYRTLPNLRWLIPLALDNSKNSHDTFVSYHCLGDKE